MCIQFMDDIVAIRPTARTPAPHGHPLQKSGAIQAFRAALLGHYNTHGRNLPWRKRHDAYAIWLSEMMLQQTTVATVIPYFERFLAHWPTVADLARADEQAVLGLWQGLGYYSRARNLLKCARQVVADFGGAFPHTAEALQKLPGIGPYTSAAIAAIAYNTPATVVDGNVERVISRLYALDTPLPDARPLIRTLAEPLTSPAEPGAYAGAIMDLGATICTPRRPKCLICPVASFCAAKNSPDPAQWPKKRPKAARPEKTGIAYVLTDGRDHILLRQRPAKGLLAGLWEVPHTGWENTPLPEAFKTLAAEAESCGTIRHVFTHFGLTLEVRTLKTTHAPAMQDMVWAAPGHAHPLPTLMRKVIAQASAPDTEE